MPNHERTSTHKEGNEKREAVLVDKKKLRGALAMGATTLAGISFAAGAGVGGAVAEANHEKRPATKEQIEESVGDFLNNKVNPNIDIRYDEDGNIESVVVTYEDSWKDGTTDKYTLRDTDGDTKYESGDMREVNGPRSANFESENGLNAEEAHAELRSKFIQRNAG